MTRSQFLGNGILSSLGFFCGKTLLATPTDSFNSWVQRHTSVVSDEQGLITLRGLPDLDGIHELDSICEGPLHASGSYLYGTYQGRNFQLHLA